MVIVFLNKNHKKWAPAIIYQNRLLASAPRLTFFQATTKASEQTNWWTRAQTGQAHRHLTGHTYTHTHIYRHARAKWTSQLRTRGGTAGWILWRLRLCTAALINDRHWTGGFTEYDEKKMKSVNSDQRFVYMTVAACLSTAGSNHHDDWSAAHTLQLQLQGAAVKPGNCMFWGFFGLFLTPRWTNREFSAQV